jgi:hypothetical protein
MNKVVGNYYIALMDVIIEFCLKQDLQFENKTGNVVCCSDLFFNFEDILYDLENNIKKGKIAEYINYCYEKATDFHKENPFDDPFLTPYKYFAKDISEAEYEKIKEKEHKKSKLKVFKAKKELIKQIKNHKSVSG